MEDPPAPPPPPEPEAAAPPPPSRLLRLRCAVQHYEWGRRGAASLVARLAGQGQEDPDDPARPYAELWMGTHPSGPSTLLHDGALLSDWLARNPDALGPAVAARWRGGLPFLFKVLSVAKALSIQAHPDKKLAEALHALRPSTYKDDNHKPEMAIAITEFRALCGFAAVEELKDVLRTVPEVEGLVGHEDAGKLMSLKEYDGGNEVKSILQSAFAKLMTASKDKVSEAIAKLINRLNTESKIRTLTDKEQLVLLLERQYQDDVGVLAALFFNYVKLSPGEALYIAANEPHAYLSGECIECMATSDNVVRAGLTPKYIDVQTLCSMLTYKPASLVSPCSARNHVLFPHRVASSQGLQFQFLLDEASEPNWLAAMIKGFPEIFRGVPVQPHVRRYTPPFNEFEVDCCLVPPGEPVVISPVPGPSIFLVMAGEGEIQLDSMSDGVMEGDVFFIPAYTEVKLSACGPEFMQLYRTGVNSRFFS